MRFYEIIRENKTADIAKLNNIRDVNKIFVGQKLKLPDGTEYTVARGDTLGAIASGRFRGTPPVQKTQAKVEPQTQKQQQMIQTQRDAEDQSLSQFITTKPNNVRIAGPHVNLTDTDDDLLTRFYTAAAEYGKLVTINSAARSDQKQAELWVRGNILKEPGVFTPAKPKNDQTITYKGKTYNVKGSGRSNSHLYGSALDITPAPGQNFVGTQFEPILKKYGLYFPYPAKDPVHLEIKKA